MLLSHCRYIEVWGEVRQARVTDVEIWALKTRPEKKVNIMWQNQFCCTGVTWFLATPP